MTPAAHLSAAIEVLEAIAQSRIPAADALKEWGRAHRFAGSGDRAGIAGVVWDTLRRYASSAWVMKADTARARVIGMLRLERELSSEAIAALFSGEGHAPSPLSEDERGALAAGTLDGAPAWVAGDYPEWLDGSLTGSFGDSRVAEASAMARRAPLDLRVNALKAGRDETRGSLTHLGCQDTPWSPWGLRIALRADARSPGIQAEQDFIHGAIEVQDEGSQLASLLSRAAPGETVIDLCAGAGGKTLALAAMMGGQGRLIATDRDKRQLAPIHERLARAGVDKAEVRPPKGDGDPLADLRQAADLVFVDAPCTGSGTWRRNPDAKWRMRPGALEQRIKDQAAVLGRAADLVRPGGRLAYVTCSVLAEENADRIEAFLADRPDFTALGGADLVTPLGGKAEAFSAAAKLSSAGLVMTPLRTGTDGFFVSVLRRSR